MGGVVGEKMLGEVGEISSSSVETAKTKKKTSIHPGCMLGERKNLQFPFFKFLRAILKDRMKQLIYM